MILDLDDSVGFEIASHFQTNCGEKRDTIKDTGAYPAFTLALPVKDANAMLAQEWPNAKPIPSFPQNMVPVMLISEGRCLVALVPRE